MFNAINTLRNNKMYSSLKVFRDLSLQQTKNNKWVAPANVIESYGDFDKNTEIEVSYIKEITKCRNGVSFSCAPHFRKHPKFNSVKIKKTNENHKLIVDFLYNMLLTDKIKDIKLVTSEYYINKEKEEFYYSKLIELDVDKESINYEVTVESENNQKRADVFVKFNKNHEIYGKGICFEIQLSKQKSEVTKERTYQRALLGLSTIWIFKEEIYTKNKDIIVPTEMVINPYINVLNTTLNKTSYDIIEKYEQQGILLDIKINEFEKKISESIKQVLDKCNAENTVCLHCKQGYVIKKSGKYGTFLSCTNYKECKK